MVAACEIVVRKTTPSGIPYSEQLISDSSYSDSWARYLTDGQEHLVKGAVLKDGRFVWSSIPDHRMFALTKEFTAEGGPAVYVDILSQCPGEGEVSIRMNVENGLENIPYVDLIMGYFQKSMGSSEKVRISVFHCTPGIQEFTGTFEEYFNRT